MIHGVGGRRTGILTVYQTTVVVVVVVLAVVVGVARCKGSGGGGGDIIVVILRQDLQISSFDIYIEKDFASLCRKNKINPDEERELDEELWWW